MKIGIGLPNPVPGTTGAALLDWARCAEERGFTALATIDRIAYPTYDSLTTLAAVAGATNTIGLFTNILLAPVYPPVLLAKKTASLDQLSGGRLTLGLAAGGREDDYTVTGRDFAARGREFDSELELLHQAWAGEPVAGSPHPVAPSPSGGRVPVMIGGAGAAAVRRTARWGVGWTAGGVPPEMAARVVERIRDAWSAAGRDGDPRLAALTYYSLGADTDDGSRTYLRDYYGFLGDYANQIAESALPTEDAIRGAVRAFADIGITELYFDPTANSVDQVNRLADVVL